MDRKQRIDAITLNQIILRKLEGIANKIEIVAETPADERLGLYVRKALRHQKEIAKQLEENNYASQ
jgi:hypothetical protein